MNRYFFLLNILLLTGAAYFGVNAFYRVATARLEELTPIGGLLVRPVRRQAIAKLQAGGFDAGVCQS